MSEKKYGEPLRMAFYEVRQENNPEPDFETVEVTESDEYSYCCVTECDDNEIGHLASDSPNEFDLRLISLFNACANRSESDIKAAFALLDNREKVVEKLEKARLIIDQNNKASGNCTSHARGCMCGGKNHLEDMTCTEITLGFRELAHDLTAALALLQAEKEG